MNEGLGELRVSQTLFYLYTQKEQAFDVESEACSFLKRV